jgi:hypothetical protein
VQLPGSMSTCAMMDVLVAQEPHSPFLRDSFAGYEVPLPQLFMNNAAAERSDLGYAVPR